MTEEVSSVRVCRLRQQAATSARAAGTSGQERGTLTTSASTMSLDDVELSSPYTSEAHVKALAPWAEQPSLQRYECVARRPAGTRGCVENYQSLARLA